jgi:hypothetical protein
MPTWMDTLSHKSITSFSLNREEKGILKINNRTSRRRQRLQNHVGEAADSVDTGSEVSVKDPADMDLGTLFPYFPPCLLPFFATFLTGSNNIPE